MAEKAEAEKEVQPVDAFSSIKAWRQEQLELAGYPDDLAQVIAACPDIDLHKAVDIVQNGCRPSIAALILL